MAHDSSYPQLNDEAWLRQRYIVEGRSAVEIAELIGGHRNAVTRALKRFGIKTVRRGPGRLVFPQLQDPEWLRREIAVKPTRQIAEELGCTAAGVCVALARHGIEIPHRAEHRYTNKSASIKKGLAERFPEGRNGEQSPRWTGGRVKRGAYWWLHRARVEERWPDHPRLALEGWSHKQEHVLVMEAELGRCLTAEERVHHGPGGQEDNRIENLTLIASQGEHVAGHWKDALEAMQLRERLARIYELTNQPRSSRSDGDRVLVAIRDIAKPA